MIERATINQQDVFRARSNLRGIARHTPLIRSEILSERVGADVRLKLETLQETGAFKVRGAANCISALKQEERSRGVVAVSTGNHGRAVAYVAGKMGINAFICVSERVPTNKIEMLQATGATIIIHGDSQDEAEIRALELVRERGLTMIHPFDDPLIIAGQGTIGLELLDDFPEVDTVLVPLSGGGLIAGIAVALKSANPEIRMIGVTMEHGAVMYHSLQAGKPIQLPEADTLADSLNGGIGLENRYTFKLVRGLVDDVILLPEDMIATGMAFATNQHRYIVEGAAAVGIAALLHQQMTTPGKHIAVILSGANVDVSLALDIARKHRED